MNFTNIFKKYNKFVLKKKIKLINSVYWIGFMGMYPTLYFFWVYKVREIWVNYNIFTPPPTPSKLKANIKIFFFMISIFFLVQKQLKKPPP